MTTMFGTFGQDAPKAGESWHLLASETDLAPVCGEAVAVVDVWTTGVMPAFKVCSACKVEALRCDPATCTNEAGGEHSDRCRQD